LGPGVTSRTAGGAGGGVFAAVLELAAGLELGDVDAVFVEEVWAMPYSTAPTISKAAIA
jgi:hypothetical protein